MADYLCNLIIPGAGKSGTSSLHTALDQHPEISMSLPKEPQFFSFDERFEGGARVHNALFPKSEGAKYFGESSQCYFAHPWAVERIQRSLIKPKIIIMLRHPIDRLFSQYKWNYKRATETNGLEVAIADRGEDINYLFDDRINMYREIGGYIAFSRYSKWVPLWQEAFGVENVMLLKSKEFFENSITALNACVDFLGVKPFKFEEPQKKNTTEQTTTQIIPKSYLRAAKFMPGSIKQSVFYARFKRRLIKHLTPEPVSNIPVPLQEHLEDVLREDIRFYNEAG